MSKTASALSYPIGKAEPNQHLHGLLAALASQLGGTLSETTTDVDLSVAPDKLRALVEALLERSTLSFDYLRNILGIDFEADGLAVKYHFYSFRHGHALQVTVPTVYENPHLPTISDLYPAANWHERETAEMFGVVFDGHPDPRNLLLEEDLRIHPLLKAHPLQAVEIKQGIESGSPGVELK